MRNKVFYSKRSNRTVYCPYLEVAFFHVNGHQAATQRCLIDTGADSFLIPYNLGLHLGLSYNYSELNSDSLAGGIGGNFNKVNRYIKITIEHKHTGKIHERTTRVAWMVPTEKQQLEINKLRERWSVAKGSYEKDRTAKLLADMDKKMKEYLEFLDQFESDPLIGREFMKNFLRLEFVHEEDESKSYFEYEIRPEIK